MSVLDRRCLFTTNNCRPTDIIKQWVFILITLVWTAIGVVGVARWHKVTVIGVSYNEAIIFMALVKFFLIYLGIIWGSSMTVLFIIFWFQAVLNVTNCFILHTIVQQFHKRNSLIGKVARGVFLTQFIALWF